MIKKTIVIILTLSSLLLSCGNYQNKKIFENITKIKLPKSSRQIQIFDNNFFVITGKYLIIDKKEIQNLLKSYGFTRLEKNKKRIIESDVFLSKENRVTFNEDDFYYISAKTEQSRWNILLNKTTGELWIEILYPGFSADTVISTGS
jgi:hypothetical protein